MSIKTVLKFLESNQRPIIINSYQGKPDNWAISFNGQNPLPDEVIACYSKEEAQDIDKTISNFINNKNRFSADALASNLSQKDILEVVAKLEKLESILSIKNIDQIMSKEDKASIFLEYADVAFSVRISQIVKNLVFSKRDLSNRIKELSYSESDLKDVDWSLEVKTKGEKALMISSSEDAFSKTNRLSNKTIKQILSNVLVQCFS